jgi:hypothetical protein
MRGKKSAASLSVVPVTPGQRPEPPADLNEKQADIWRSVVATKPADWFAPDSFPLLVAYCRAIVVHHSISEQIDSFDMAWLADDDGLKRYDKLASIQERQARLIASLATRMRLSQQSRYKAETASTADKKAGGAIKPWEFGKVKD